jgi:hypothetical protein
MRTAVAQAAPDFSTQSRSSRSSTDCAVASIVSTTPPPSSAARERLSGQADPRDVRHPALRAILTALRAHPDLPPPALIHRLEGDEPRGWLARLLVEEIAPEDPTPEIEAMARLLELHQGRRRTRELAQALARAESDGTSGPGDLQGVLDEARRVLGMTAPKTKPTEDVRP